MIKHPSFQILSSNIIAGLASFLISIYALRWIKIEDYGIFALITSFFGIAANFVDLRLNDYIATIFFDKETSRGSLVKFSFIVHCLLSTLLILVGLISLKFCWSFFSGTSPQLFLFILVGLGSIFNYLASTLTFQFRLFYSFKSIVLLNILNVGSSLAFYFFLVGHFQSLTAYSGAFCLNAFCNLLFSATLMLQILYKSSELRSPLDWKHNIQKLKKKHIFLFYGNLSGYVKLLHRSADTLLVGYFLNEHATGIYKFARTLSDKLYLVYDALNQVYFPRLLEYLKNDFKLFLKTSHKLNLFALLFTVIILFGEILLWTPFCHLFFKGQFIEAKIPVLVFTATFFFVTGPILSYYPLVLHTQNLKRYFVFNLSSVLLLQYGLSLLLFKSLDVSAFSIGYFLSYLPLVFFVTSLKKKERGHG